jgi:cytochrome c553
MKTFGPLLCASWLAAAGCQPANAVDETPPLGPPARFEHDMVVRLHMHENFDLLRAIEKLLVRGNLEDARALARAIAEAPDEPGLEPFAKQAAVVRDRAASLVKASTIAEACRREAQLAAACAGCHVETGVVPEFRSTSRVPRDEPTIAARMARHLWATDRLWEGIVGGSDESWRKGLDVLAAAPVDVPPISTVQAPLAKQLQQQADRARQRQKADTIDERASAYGEILTTCAGCHSSRPRSE